MQRSVCVAAKSGSVFVMLAAINSGTWAIAAEPRDISQCAVRDLRLLTLIESHGQAEDVPSDKLSHAFFSMMSARAACATGQVEKALEIYDSIADEFARAAEK